MNKKEAQETAKSTVIAIFSQGKNEIRITKSFFAGNKYIDIRSFYSDNGVFKPSKKGISISEDNFPKLMKSLQKVVIGGD